MSKDNICQRISCWLPDVMRMHGCILKVPFEIVPMQVCEDACKQEAVGSDLGGHREVCGPRSQENSIDFVRQGVQDEEARQNSKSLICFSVVFCNATT